MTKDEIRAAVLEALKAVAPEVEEASLDPEESLREQLDVDSMDFLNFVIGLHEALKIDIPEADYAKLATLNGAIDYVAAHAAAA